jgi:SAM-dependent methyltransferase
MQPQIRISKAVQDLLRCPKCHAKQNRTGEQLECSNSGCAAHFPILDGIPVLINEQSSIFSVDDFISHRKTFFGGVSEKKLHKLARRLTPRLGKNIKGKANYARMGERLLKQSASPRVLVVGGSILGEGMESLVNNPAIEFVESDVSFGPRTALISDAHEIPFEDGSFDGVIVQAVLEHVVDPYQCSEEIHRVLKEGGVVYAETPFMQQVHGGRFDFTRFTHLGHRRLFRKFEEIDSGAVCGPGMALAWAYQYFLLSFTTSKIMRALIRIFAGFTAFYLTYFDYFLINRPGALDAASGLYFMGTKTGQVLSDRDLVKLYKGAGS